VAILLAETGPAPGGRATTSGGMPACFIASMGNLTVDSTCPTLQRVQYNAMYDCRQSFSNVFIRLTNGQYEELTTDSSKNAAGDVYINQGVVNAAENVCQLTFVILDNGVHDLDLASSRLMFMAAFASPCPDSSSTAAPFTATVVLHDPNPGTSAPGS